MKCREMGRSRRMQAAATLGAENKNPPNLVVTLSFD
jgi:hypothetical protein